VTRNARISPAPSRIGACQDRLPSGREFVENGDIEIAIDGHPQRARDGRRGHDQDVGILALATERQPLEHAEFMLLVDDDKPELVRRVTIIEEGMRSHHD